MLERAGSISETEGHHQPLKGAVAGVKGGLPFISVSNADQMIHMLEIEFGLDLSSTWGFEEVRVQGSGYWSFFMILFRPQKSMQWQREPSFFQTKRTGVAWGENNWQMKLFIRCSSRKSQRDPCSDREREYSLPMGGSVPSFRSKGQLGARVLAFFLLKTSM